MPVDRDEFRTALGRFATGVTVVTTCDAGQRPHGLTVSAFSSLSLEPPLVLICVARDAASHHALSESGMFVVNILAEDQESLARHFAAPETDKFQGIAFHTGIEGVPVLDKALANLECRVVHRYDGGDHTIFVGEVEATSMDLSRPLMYFKGGYARLTL